VLARPGHDHGLVFEGHERGDAFVGTEPGAPQGVGARAGAGRDEEVVPRRAAEQEHPSGGGVAQDPRGDHQLVEHPVQMRLARDAGRHVVEGLQQPVRFLQPRQQLAVLAGEARPLARLRHRARQPGNVQVALLQVVEDAVAQPVDGRAHVALAGEDQDLRVRADLLDLFRQLDAAHTRHHEVEHGHAEAPVGHEVQGGARIGSGAGVEALVDEELRDQ